MGISKIGIVFGDNDFRVTVTSFMSLFLPEQGNRKHTLSTKLTKKIIVESFNKIAPTIYWLSQNGLTYDLNWDAEKYIQINESSVYLDDEVDTYLLGCTDSTGTWDNSEFHYVTMADLKITTI